MRFALPLLVVAVVATWFYTRKTGNWIDVHQLQPLPVATVALPEEEGHDQANPNPENDREHDAGDGDI